MRKLPPILSILTIVAAGIFSGCMSDAQPDSGDDQPIRLRVAAASDMQPWLGPALETWGKSRNPHIRIETSYGSSHQLAAQIRAGAPIDLFLSADASAVTSVDDQGMIVPQSIRPYAVGGLAILCRKSLKISILQDLENADFRYLAIASPAGAPYGKAAKAALVTAGLWPKLEGRIVTTATAREAFRNVVDGNAEVGIVSLGHALAAAGEDPNLMAIEIPQKIYPPIVQFLGIVRTGESLPEKSRKQKLEAVEQLSAWIVGPETDGLFRSHAFERPTTAEMVKEPEKPNRPAGQ